MKAELVTLYLVWFPEGTAPRPTALCDLPEDSGTKASSAIWAMGGNLFLTHASSCIPAGSKLTL